MSSIRDFHSLPFVPQEECSLCHHPLTEGETPGYFWQGHFYRYETTYGEKEYHIFHSQCVQELFQRAKGASPHCPQCDVVLVPLQNFIEAVLRQDQNAVRQLCPSPSLKLLEESVKECSPSAAFNLKTAQFLISLAVGADQHRPLLDRIAIHLIQYGHPQDFKDFLLTFPTAQGPTTLLRCLELAMLTHTHIEIVQFFLQEEPWSWMMEEKRDLLKKALISKTPKILGLILTRCSIQKEEIIEAIQGGCMHTPQGVSKEHVQEILSYCQCTLQLDENALKEFAENLAQAMVSNGRKMTSAQLEAFIPIFAHYREDFLFLTAKVGTVDFIQNFFRFKRKEPRTD